MKTYKYVIEDGMVSTFYVEPEVIKRLESTFGMVFNTYPEADKELKRRTEIKIQAYPEQKLTDQERFALERRQQKFAESMYTEEDWIIVNENRRKRVSIDEQQLRYGRWKMRQEKCRRELTN